MGTIPHPTPVKVDGAYGVKPESKQDAVELARRDIEDKRLAEKDCLIQDDRREILAQRAQVTALRTALKDLADNVEWSARDSFATSAETWEEDFKGEDPEGYIVWKRAETALSVNQMVADNNVTMTREELRNRKEQSYVNGVMRGRNEAEAQVTALRTALEKARNVHMLGTIAGHPPPADTTNEGE